jgi:hypothetical protein
MQSKIPEIEARDILTNYEGFNNQLLEFKKKFLEVKNFKLTRPQAEYVIKYHEVIPRVAKKYINVASNFGEKLMEDKHLPKVPEKVWCEKLLCESDKAYHIWGRVTDSEKNYAMWLPKSSIIQEEKKLNREVDYSPYSKRPPMEHQKVAIEKLLANDRYILADDMGLGKAEFVENKVFTPYGRKRIGDLKIGDEVIGSDGKKCNVQGVYPQGIKDLYRVTFNDGVSVLVCKEHLFSVRARSFGHNTKNSRNKKEIVLSIGQMIDEELFLEVSGEKNNINRNYKFKTYFKEKGGNSKWQIPIVKPIEFNSNELELNPYLLGLILGDGGITQKGVSFTTEDVEIVNYIKPILPENSQITENKNSKYGYRLTKKTGHTNPIIQILKELNLMGCGSHNKFIPTKYKYSSINDRLEILKGLMDTDGTCSIGKKGNFEGTEFSTVSERLCDDVIEIVHSLGGIARKKSRTTNYTYKGEKKEGKKSYRVNIKLPSGMNPFKLKRKYDLYNTPEKYKVGRYIKDIKFEGNGEAICISVDSPDKLYVTEHAIVTHNTTSAIIASMESGAKKVLIICPASLKINWQREIENYSDKKTLIVEGKKWGSTFDYYIINYDIIKNYHSMESVALGEEIRQPILKEKFDLVIIDEAHYISNPTAQRTKLINDIVDKIPKVWLLTGTPMTSRPINYYNILKIVQSPIALNWQTYVKRYCGGYQFTVNGKKIWNTGGATNLDELRDRTKNLVLRRMKTDVLDLPDKIITPIFLDLKSTFYDEELEDFMRITNDNKNKESISITINRLMKVRQVIAYEKVEYTSEIIDRCLEQGKKVIVFTNFTMTLDMLHEKYKKNSVVLDGRMSKEKRQQSVDRFQNEDKIKIFISNIIAGGVGITLTSAEVVIMNDLSFVPAHHSQAEDRAFRYGQKKNVIVYYPIFENTMEKIVYNILNKKKNIIDQVMGDGDFSESFATSLLKELV